jgi:hypothetical protein
MSNGANLILQGSQPALAAAKPVSSFIGGMQQGQDIVQNQLTNLLGQQKVAAGEQKLAAGQIDLQSALDSLGMPDITTAEQVAQDVAILNQLPDSMKLAKAESIRSNAISQGRTTENIDEYINTFKQNPEQAQQLLDASISGLRQTGILKPEAEQQAVTAFQKERADLLSDLQPALDESGKLDVNRLDARSKSAAIKLGLISGEGRTTKEERLAEDPDKTERVATSQARIKSAVKEAEVIAKARGETVTELTKAKAALPGIKEVVGQLKVLADDATFTLGGQAFNQVAKQFGYSVDGDTARSSMIALIDNQVLPLLRPIFGAAFTKAEGDSLKQALANPDSTPESRKAQLDAFLNQMVRNIESKERELNPEAPQESAQDFDLEYDPATGEFK